MPQLSISTKKISKFTNIVGWISVKQEKSQFCATLELINGYSVEKTSKPAVRLYSETSLSGIWIEIEKVLVIVALDHSAWYKS